MEILYCEFGKLLLCVSGYFDNPVWVSIDRTNWKFGKRKINFLVIGIVFRRISIPIVWCLLDKQGNSSSSERIALFKKALKIIPKDKILGILADREFIGEEWFHYLLQLQIPYLIRLKANRIVEFEDGSTIQLKHLFKGVQKGRKSKAHNVRLGEHPTNVKAKRLHDGSLLIVAFSGIKEVCPISTYRKRWTIETTFSCMKKRGFNLEDTHMTDLNKLKKLFAIVALAVVWAVKIGTFLQKDKIKKHGYRENSDFHLGKNTIIQKITITDIHLISTLYHNLHGGVNSYVV